jgi:hypothetical protein
MDEKSDEAEIREVIIKRTRKQNYNLHVACFEK